MIRYFLLLILCVVGGSAQARVFDFSKESFATYIRGTYGPSLAADNAYNGSSGAGVSYDQLEQSNYSAEAGFLLTSKRYTFRLGAEYLFPKHLTAVTGSNSSGVALYTLDTQITALAPTATIEVVLKSGQTWRAMLGGSYGYAFANLANKYTFTAAGKSQFGLPDFEDDASASVSNYSAFMAFEFLLTDVVTMDLDAGYRYSVISSWKQNAAVTGFQGAAASGDPLMNADGSNVTTNLSGPFAGVSFRFYFR